MMRMSVAKNYRGFTLCWDCERAIGGCSWVDDFIPVKGWFADTIKPSPTKPSVTYLVKDCPLFVRDGYKGGTMKAEEVDVL